MMTDFTKLSLTELRSETAAIAAEAQQSFGHLHTQQLNWKPSAETWSIAQCLEHVMANDHPMLQVMDTMLAGTNQHRFYEHLPLLPTLFGKMMIKVVSPDFKQKLKSPPAGRPTTSEIDAQIVSHFLAHQLEIAERINEVERLNVAQLVMTSPFVRWITYNLLDACRLIVAHERRHLAQAQRIAATADFPR